MITSTIIVITVIVNAVIAAFVLLKNPRNQVNQALFLIIISLSLWLFANHLADNSATLPLFWNKATFVGPILMSTFFFIFANLISNKNISKLTYLIVFTAAVLFITISFTSLVVENISPRIVNSTVLGYEVSRGPVYPVLIGWLLFLATMSLTILYKKYRKTYGLEKAQLQYVFLAMGLAAASSIFTNIVLPLATGSTAYARFAPVSSVFLVFFLSYAILKHRFLDIRLVVARSVAYLLLLVTLGFTYGSLVFALSFLFIDTATATLQQQIFYTVLAVLVAFTFQPLRRFFEKLTDRIFFRDKYDTQEVLSKLGSIYISKINSFELLDDSLKVIVEALKVEFGHFIVMDDDKVYKTAHFGSRLEKLIRSDDLAKLPDKLTIYDELPESFEQKELLREANIYSVLKLYTQDGLIGYLMLGFKQSGSIYTKQDIDLLEILSQELAVAIQNAKSYEEIANFSETLKQEVREATAKLRETNKKLRKLDQAKDEFISMASHQLRTPLTTVKGYLSMLLEGDAGKISKEQRDFIDMAFVSSQRMVHLISDMLNVSRISTGKLTIDKAPFNIVEVVKSEVAQLQRHAEARDVQLTFHKPKQQDIQVNLDEGKLRQVIMNFIDNAIYYTPEGKVDVFLSKKDNCVEFKVVDNGIGVSKEAQKQLFSKFFRAENAQHVRPDGTGLGLFMAKQVIESQGGKIVFSSQKGKGSTFGFRFELKD